MGVSENDNIFILGWSIPLRLLRTRGHLSERAGLLFCCLVKVRLGFPPGVLSVSPDAQRHPAQLLSVLLPAVRDGGASLERRSGSRLLSAADAAAVAVLARLPLRSALLLLHPHRRLRQLQQSLHFTGASLIGSRYSSLQIIAVSSLSNL